MSTLSSGDIAAGFLTFWSMMVFGAYASAAVRAGWLRRSARPARAQEFGGGCSVKTAGKPSRAKEHAKRDRVSKNVETGVAASPSRFQPLGGRSAARTGEPGAPFEKDSADAVVVPTLHVIRPCAGPEPRLFDNLVSLVRAVPEPRETGSSGSRGTSGSSRGVRSSPPSRSSESAGVTSGEPSFSLRISLVVEKPEGETFATVERAAAVLRSSGFEAAVVVARPPRLRPFENPKVVLLAEADKRVADADAVVVADCDVDLAGFDLERLAQPVLQGGWAAAWAAPIEGAQNTFADRLSRQLLAGSFHAFAFLGALDARTFVGKTFAVRRSVLQRVGGFEQLLSFLGEDFELVRRLRARGARVQAVPVCVLSTAQKRTLRALFARYCRWLVVVRLQRPWALVSYPLVVAAVPLIAAVGCGLWLREGQSLAATAAALAVGARAGLALYGRRLAGGRSRSGGWLEALALAPLVDSLVLATWLAALVRPRVLWRGRLLTPQSNRGRGLRGAPAPRDCPVRS